MVFHPLVKKGIVMNFTSLLGVVIVAFGIWIVLGAGKKLGKLNRFEFENRSSGGVVGFKSYEESIIHHKKLRSAKRQITISVWVLFLGLSLLFSPFFF